MFECRKLINLNDCFAELSRRTPRGVYFCRINGYNAEVRAFLERYCEAARQSGIVIEGRIANPDEKNLSYYQEMMGTAFQMSPDFILRSLKRWLPRMNSVQCADVAAALYDTLDQMRRAGKNDNMLKNAYVKFMCWFYYRFERVISRLGDSQPPKILYEGEIGNYELKLLSILARAGCDAVLLQYRGDASYRKLDPDSALSCEYTAEGLAAFPDGFCLKKLREEALKRADRERLYGPKPQTANCTNAWMEGNGFPDFLKSPRERGNDERFFYNAFCRINGAEDKLTYLNELYRFWLALKDSGRRLLIIEKNIPRPLPAEVNAFPRKNYADFEQMIADLSKYIRFVNSQELERLARKAFIDLLLAESETPGMNVSRLTGRAVYLLCWLRRFQTELFERWQMPKISCLIWLGGCQSENEALFLRFLSRLPTDVLLFKPNLNEPCCLNDRFLYEINYGQSLTVDHFPREDEGLRMGTAAYHAERELDTLMYQDSGIYRSQQYGKAASLTLQTMYEEIAILWKEDVSYRPNFSVSGNMVNIPVIFAKVCGVKDGNTAKYWADIRSLITADTVVFSKAPHISPTDPNPLKAYAAEFFKNGRLQRERIKGHNAYQYGFLREEIQEHIFDKLQLLIDRRLIKGTFENGTEYTVVATVLNMGKDIARLLQKFDFTKKNPKLIYINTSETLISLEDSILAAFLNLAGFDVVFFVPTGYRSVERYFNRDLMEEHQIGEYLYDLQAPPLGAALSDTPRRSWREKIFKRGS